MNIVFIRESKERFEIQRHRGRGQVRTSGGGDWSDASVSQETPRIAHGHQKLEERHGTDSLWCWTSGPQKRDRIHSSYYKPYSLW